MLLFKQNRNEGERTMTYNFSQFREKVILVEADSQYALCSMFLRPQEFYESPYANIRGRYFTLEEYMDTCVRTTGAFTYYSDWCGFNIPSKSFVAFVNLFQYSLSAKENLLVNSIRNLIPNLEDDFYIIGVCKGKWNKEALNHELAHAFWYLDANYQSEMKDLLRNIDKCLYEDADAALVSVGYDFGVVQDEMQAYLATASRQKILNVLGWRKHLRVRIPRAIAKYFKTYYARPHK